MAGFRIEGNTSGNVAEINALNHLKVISETDIITNPTNVGAVKSYIENSTGIITGAQVLLPQEIDSDYRTRVSQDIILDEEMFFYTAQNTGKHAYLNTTMTDTWTAGQLTTNGSSITTISTGTVFNTYATFPNISTQTLSVDVVAAFSAQPVANSFIEFGFGIPSTQLVAPTDGIFLRLSSAGLQGIAAINGAEISTGIFPLSGGTGTWVYTNAKKYQFIIYASGVSATFWVNDGTTTEILGSIILPTGSGRVSMAPAGQFFIKHRIAGGAAGGVLQGLFSSYNVRLGGNNLSSSSSEMGNKLYGSYQGLSGSTMGTLARVGTITTGNEANVAAAVPTTTTAALGTGLGGTFWETISLAVNTDGIIMSYQVPAGTALIQGRRLILRGMYLNSYVQTVLVGGPYIAEWFLAFGHTAVSLATAEAATTKAPRRIALPFTQAITAAQAVSTAIAQAERFVNFGNSPVIVNPGEFIQLCTRHIGTVGTSGTVVHRVTCVYGWE